MVTHEKQIFKKAQLAEEKLAFVRRFRRESNAARVTIRLKPNIRIAGSEPNQTKLSRLSSSTMWRAQNVKPR
jgi:hypothetical protein